MKLTDATKEEVVKEKDTNASRLQHSMLKWRGNLLITHKVNLYRQLPKKGSADQTAR